MENQDHGSQSMQKVCEILDHYKRSPSNLIPILHAVQNEYRYLPEDVMNFVATSLDIPVTKVFGVATFYGHFALQPKGKYIIKICDGTACHVKGSMKLYDAIQKRLGLSEDKKTTTDMLFTLETVSCLGACGLAPAVVVNEDVHGQVTPVNAVSIVEDIMKKETKL